MDYTSKIISYMAGFISLFLLSCASQTDVDSWEAPKTSPSIVPAIHWSQDMAEDSCARCPECCVVVTEAGFIDPYGVERPLTWLPEADGGIE